MSSQTWNRTSLRENGTRWR